MILSGIKIMRILRNTVADTTMAGRVKCRSQPISIICVSYRTVCTLPISTMLRTAQTAKDCGDERFEDQAEDDDQDKSQCIFHILKRFLSLCFRPSGPGDAYIFLLLESEPVDEGKPETENTLPKEGRLSVSPGSLVWLDVSDGELRFAEKDIRQSTGPHKRKQVFRLKKKTM